MGVSVFYNRQESRQELSNFGIIGINTFVLFLISLFLHFQSIKKILTLILYQFAKTLWSVEIPNRKKVVLKILIYLLQNIKGAHFSRHATIG